MTATGTQAVDTFRRPIASAFTALAVIKAGTTAVRIVTADGDTLTTIAAGATAEVEPQGRTVYAVANSPTEVEISKYTVADLRADAAAEFRVPVELIHGRSKAEIGESAVRFYAHERAAQ